MNFNGNDLSDLIIVTKIERDILPDISLETITPPRAFGSHYVRKKISPRKINVDFTIKRATHSDVRSCVMELAEILDRDDPAVLYFYDEPNIIYNTLFFGSSPTSEIINLAKGTLQFLCPDPYKYAATATVLTNPAAVTQDGQPTPCQIKLTIGTASAYAYVQVGTDIIRFDRAFAIGDVLTIDTGKRTALLNGAIDIRPNKTITSEWFLLKGGAVTVYPATSTLEITYRKRWL